LATGLAACAHLLAFLAIGWRIPKAPPPLPPDTLPPVELQLLRPTPRPAPSAAPAAPAAQGRPSAAGPGPAEPFMPSAPVVAPSAPALAEGPPDCAPEDLPLLTEAEKARCRNAIDAAEQRRFARGADERAANQVAQAQRGPQTYRMDGDKEADLDAVAQANAHQGHEPTFVGGGKGIAGVSCKNVSIPLLGGVEINPNLFAHKGKQEHKPRPTHHCKAVL
jgi:hypothetical protein